jgi:Domain of unknown function (DUF4398)
LLRSIEKSTMAHFSSLRLLRPAVQDRARARPVTAWRCAAKCARTTRFGRLPVVLVIAGLVLAACAGAPVQEMSNARQAIRAARDAGAEKMAPQKLNEAEALLNRAEDSLERRAYKEARRNAIAAHDKAAEALGAVHPDSNTG